MIEPFPTSQRQRGGLFDGSLAGVSKMSVAFSIMLVLLLGVGVDRHR